MKLYLIPLLIILTLTSSLCQTSKVLVRNNGLRENKNLVFVKWYSKELIFPEGVNIYRKEQGKIDWEKINTSPIEKMDKMPKEEVVKDPELDFFTEVVSKAKKEDLQGIIMINLLVKSFQSPVFSRFLGIQYEDNAVQEGIVYEYKVVKINKGKEETLGMSAPVLVASGETLEAPVKGIEIKAGKKKVEMKWTPEDDRFYGVNIYRKSSLETDFVKLNKTPLMMSKSKGQDGTEKYPEVMFKEDSLQEGVSYTYILGGADFFGTETEKSKPLTITIKDLTPPLPPLGLKDSLSKMQVNLSWKGSTSKDVAGYNVYRSTKSDGKFVKVNPALVPAGNTFYKDKITKPSPYYYYVSAVDSSANEGRSEPIFVDVNDIIPPAKPTGVIARADTGKIVLQWKANVEQDLKGYLIYRTINKNDKENFVLLNSEPLKESNYTDVLPKNARNSFLYKVVAIDSSYNKSEASEIARARMPDIIPPMKPLIINIKDVEDGIVVQWLHNKDLDWKGYNIYRKTADENAFRKLNHEHIPVLDSAYYADRMIASGSTYLYYLTAIDSTGNESEPSDIERAFNHISRNTSINDVKLKVKNDKSEIHISWKQDRAEDLLGYVIYRKDHGSGDLKAITNKVKDKYYIDKGIKKGMTYTYQVRAYDKTGNITKSEHIQITIKE